MEVIAFRFTKTILSNALIAQQDSLEIVVKQVSNVQVSLYLPALGTKG